MKSAKSKNSTQRSKASKKPTVNNQDSKSKISQNEVTSHNVTKSQFKDKENKEELSNTNNNISKDDHNNLKKI